MDPALLIAVCAAFLLAGTVKGVIGLGLPPVSLGLLVLVMDLPEAMGVLIVPSLVTNVWQGLSGGGTARLLKRLWPFLLPSGLFVLAGALALTRVDLDLLSALLGVVLTIYAATGLAGLAPSLDARSQLWAGPAAGALTGMLAGMTGSFSVPGVLYLQAAGLERDELVKAMGLLFTTLTVGLAVALGANGLASGALGLLSVAAVIPAILGMLIGQAVRRRMPQRLFRRVFFAGLLVLGLYIALRALLQ